MVFMVLEFAYAQLKFASYEHVRHQYLLAGRGECRGFRESLRSSGINTVPLVKAEAAARWA